MNAMRKTEEGFVGREWLFANIRDWLQNGDTLILLIVGDAGKSAAARQLFANALISMGSTAVALHVCNPDNKRTLEPAKFVLFVWFQVGRWLHERNQAGLLDPELSLSRCRSNPVSVFVEAVLLPLQKAPARVQASGLFRCGRVGRMPCHRRQHYCAAEQRSCPTLVAVLASSNYHVQEEPAPSQAVRAERLCAAD
jgi:hypothetical protein